MIIYKNIALIPKIDNWGDKAMSQHVTMPTLISNTIEVLRLVNNNGLAYLLSDANDLALLWK